MKKLKHSSIYGFWLEKSTEMVLLIRYISIGLLALYFISTPIFYKNGFPLNDVFLFLTLGGAAVLLASIIISYEFPKIIREHYDTIIIIISAFSFAKLSFFAAYTGSTTPYFYAIGFIMGAVMLFPVPRRVGINSILVFNGVMILPNLIIPEEPFNGALFPILPTLGVFTIIVGVLYHLILRYRITEWQRREELQLKGNELTQQKNRLAKALISVRKSEQGLTRSNELKDKLLRILGHDVRGPLGSFNSLLNLLVDHPQQFSEEEKGDMLVKLREASHENYELVSSLLMWAKNQVNLSDFNPQTSNLNDLVMDTVKQITGQADQKDIRITTNFSNEMMASVDEQMIKIVIRNLITNGIKFSKRGDEIIISTYKESDSLYIKVTDFGIGMDEGTQNKLFKQEIKSKKGTEDEKGTGLGLILCNELIEQHEGQLLVQSTPGMGTTITIRIPRHQALKKPVEKSTSSLVQNF